jgi:hypothetical protein
MLRISSTKTDLFRISWLCSATFNRKSTHIQLVSQSSSRETSKVYQKTSISWSETAFDNYLSSLCSTTKSRDSEQISFCARYSEHYWTLLKILNRFWTLLKILDRLKICVFGTKVGKAEPRLCPSFKLHTHQLYILMHCTNSVDIANALYI